MAKKVVQQITYIDDLTGEELTDETYQQVHFGWDGTNYQIDLSKLGAAKLEKFITPYVEAAQKISATRGRTRGASGGSGKRPGTGSGLSKETLAQIREWSAKNGRELSSRGRVPQDVIDAWEAAHKSE